MYQHDITASLETWRTLLRRPAPIASMRRSSPRCAPGSGSPVSSRRSARPTRHRTPRASHRARTRGAVLLAAQAYLRLGEAHDRLSPIDAMAAYVGVACVPAGDPYNVRREPSERLRKAPNARHAEAFRLSLDGWRKLDRKTCRPPPRRLNARRVNPRDPVARYRYGRVLLARRESRGARKFVPAIHEAARARADRWRRVPRSRALHERAGRTPKRSARTAPPRRSSARRETHHRRARAGRLEIASATRDRANCMTRDDPRREPQRDENGSAVSRVRVGAVVRVFLSPCEP